MPVTTYNYANSIQIHVQEESESTSAIDLDVSINNLGEYKKTAIEFTAVQDLIEGSVTSATLKLTIDTTALDLSTYHNEIEIHGIEVGGTLPATGAAITSAISAQPELVRVLDSTIDATGSGNVLSVDVTQFFNKGQTGTSFIVYFQTLQNTSVHDPIFLEFSSVQIEADISAGSNFVTDKTLDDVTLDSTVEVLIQAALNLTLDDAEVAASTGVVKEFLLSRVLDSVTLSAEADFVIRAYLDKTLEDVNLTSEYFDEPPILAFLDKTLDDATLDGELEWTPQAQVDVTLDDVTLDAELRIDNPFILGVTLEDVTLTAKYNSQETGFSDRNIFPQSIFLGTRNAIFN